MARTASTTRRGRRAVVLGIALATIVSASILSTTAGSAVAQEDRWSGQWDVEGQSFEGGSFSHFGVLTLELTDESLPHGESDSCTETDLRYVGTYAYGGGGTFEGCELASLNYGLYGKYYDDDGSWGHAHMDFTAGSPATFEGYYSPPTFGTAGEPATLQWRASKLPDSCPAPESVRRRTAALQTDGQQCSKETEIDFAFSHGGRNSDLPRKVNDMTTSGQGQFVIEERCTVANQYSGPYKDLTVRVVRTVEVDINKFPFTDEYKLVFTGPADGTVACAPERDWYDIAVSLHLVRSNDPDCRARNGGRAANLNLREHDDPDRDFVQLEVAGCKMHSVEFTDGGPKKPHVKVAIDNTHRSAPPPARM